MSPVWIKIFTILGLCYTAEMKGVAWKDAGQLITIQCRTESEQDFLELKKGINKDTVIVVIEKTTGKTTISKEMSERVQTHGQFPNVDILIKNLSVSDTGPYWCVYSKTDETYKNQITQGKGSLLLVVTAKSEAIPETSTEELKRCEQSSTNMIPIYVVIAVAVLLIIMLGFLVWIIPKTKNSDNTTKPRRVATHNDVYEDMRGTLRR